MRKLDFGRLRAASGRRRGRSENQYTAGRIAAEEEINISDEELDSELQLAALQSRERSILCGRV